MALSTTAMMMPSAMVRTAWPRCGCGRPSACSMGAGDMMAAGLIRAVVRLRTRKLRDASQPGRIRAVPAPGAGLPAPRAWVGTTFAGSPARGRLPEHIERNEPNGHRGRDDPDGAVPIDSAPLGAVEMESREQGLHGKSAHRLPRGSARYHC